MLLGRVAGLVLLLNVPLAQDFFHLALPPADMLWAAVIAAVGGGLAVELLAWIDGRRFPG